MGCRYIDTRAEGGLTALHLAALSGTLACVQLLLEAGASMMVRLVLAALDGNLIGVCIDALQCLPLLSGTW